MIGNLLREKSIGRITLHSFFLANQLINREITAKTALDQTGLEIELCYRHISANARLIDMMVAFKSRDLLILSYFPKILFCTEWQVWSKLNKTRLEPFIKIAQEQNEKNIAPFQETQQQMRKSKSNGPPPTSSEVRDDGCDAVFRASTPISISALMT